MGIDRRELVGSLAAGALLAGMASTAKGETAMSKASTDVSAHEQIRNLLAEYSFLLDSAQYAKWGQLFGEKGVLELNGEVWATGSEGIAKKMSEVMNQTPRPVTGFTGDHMYRHIFTNTHITVDEAAGTAKADSYFFVLHVFHGSPPTIRGGGRYHDRFAREGGAWRFTAKSMDFDWSDAG